MKDRIGKKSLRALAIFGACSSGGGGGGVREGSSSHHHAAAFSPPLSSSCRRSGRRRRDGAGLNAIGAKRPRTSLLLPPGAPTVVPETEIDSESHLADSTTTRRKPKVKFDLLPDFMQKDPLAVTKQRWLDETVASSSEEEEDKPPMSDREKSEMMAMTALSVAFAVGVVYALASSTPEMVTSAAETAQSAATGAAAAAGTDLKESESLARDLMREGDLERLEIATRNIVGTVLPQNAEEVIAVSIGEGIAGAIGAFATWLLGTVLNLKGDEEFVVTGVVGGAAMDSKRSGGGMDTLMSDAVADGDYFLTRAAAQPLLEGLGIPIFIASLASVVIATLPYEAVKLSTQKRRSQMEQELLLDILLEEEEKRKSDMNVVDKVSNNVFGFIQELYVRESVDDDFDFDDFEDEDEVDPVQQQLDKAPEIDYVELFADLTKWLEYDVLITNYRGVLALPNGMMLASGWESAIFGLLAALSSQLYTDVLYLYSDFGNPLKRERAINRSLEGWASVYATKCLSAATLFGVYEAVREPTSQFVSRVLSGGAGGCDGSANVELCMETYMADNPPAATMEAEFRAFAVSAMNWADILSPLNDQETFGNFARGAAVSAYSVLDRFFDM